MQEAARSSRAGTTGGKQERVHHAVRTPRGEQVAQGTVIPPRQPSLFRRPPGGVDGPTGGAVHNIGESVRRPWRAGLLAGTLVVTCGGRLCSGGVDGEHRSLSRSRSRVRIPSAVHDGHVAKLGKATACKAVERRFESARDLQGAIAQRESAGIARRRSGFESL
jgi:hypothetical protein